ncbi:hypothetical protein [Sphingomonas sp. UYEF23]|uniref:hypothetical protein n=1 Tax=Sphingomonas sp. UYEF23 TaxID=1756408 RepID=UPI0033996CE0
MNSKTKGKSFIAQPFSHSAYACNCWEADVANYGFARPTTGSFEQFSLLVPSNIVSEIDAPIQVFAIMSGLDNGSPRPDTRVTLAMSRATDEDDRTMTASNRLTTVP